jgi:transcriptional regulator with XRE-family HTH domain
MEMNCSSTGSSLTTRRWNSANGLDSSFIVRLRLSSNAGVAPNTLSLIERGEANPTWETVKGIAAALGVAVSGLAKAAERLEG